VQRSDKRETGVGRKKEGKALRARWICWINGRCKFLVASSKSRTNCSKKEERGHRFSEGRKRLSIPERKKGAKGKVLKRGKKKEGRKKRNGRKSCEKQKLSLYEGASFVSAGPTPAPEARSGSGEKKVSWGEGDGKGQMKIF